MLAHWCLCGTTLHHSSEVLWHHQEQFHLVAFTPHSWSHRPSHVVGVWRWSPEHESILHVVEWSTTSISILVAMVGRVERAITHDIRMLQWRPVPAAVHLSFL